jgi:hypothetical protein
MSSRLRPGSSPRLGGPDELFGVSFTRGCRLRVKLTVSVGLSVAAWCPSLVIRRWRCDPKTDWPPLRGALTWDLSAAAAGTGPDAVLWPDQKLVRLLA